MGDHYIEDILMSIESMPVESNPTLGKAFPELYNPDSFLKTTSDYDLLLKQILDPNGPFEKILAKAPFQEQTIYDLSDQEYKALRHIEYIYYEFKANIDGFLNTSKKHIEKRWMDYHQKMFQEEDIDLVNRFIDFYSVCKPYYVKLKKCEQSVLLKHNYIENLLKVSEIIANTIWQETYFKIESSLKFLLTDESLTPEMTDKIIQDATEYFYENIERVKREAREELRATLSKLGINLEIIDSNKQSLAESTVKEAIKQDIQEKIGEKRISETTDPASFPRRRRRLNKSSLSDKGGTPSILKTMGDMTGQKIE